VKEEFEKEYVQSGIVLEAVLKQLSTEPLEGQKKRFLSLKFMGAVIHNEVCRELYVLLSNPTNDTSKLIAIGPLILKLFEAHSWYQQVGNKELRLLSIDRDIKESFDQQLKEMKALKPSRIEKYSHFRNKMSGHYDEKYFSLVKELGAVDQHDFFNDVLQMVRYGTKWMLLLSSIGILESGANESNA
jgi:hypothetical protein